ncbi:MAG TPA: translation elongation factor Ts [Fimbriimonas sp.]|nr:translation elongation factor Ts [Fimbriimonas sp.]
MPNYTAQDVKKLREDTDAPMMECKAALDEADGDYDKAKQILREKGKAAAAKRAGRSTAAGVVAFASSPDGKTVGGVVVESETDFVARNGEFIQIAQTIAEHVRDGATAASDEIKQIVEGAVAKIRENIRVARAERLTSDAGIATYVHHDRTKGSAIVLSSGDATNEAVRKVAVQVVSAPPEVVNKEELSQDKIAEEIESETRRAINEGKPENIARNIAQGRVNKEFIKKVVLLEQPFYIDPSKTVGQYLAESAKDAKVAQAVYLAVGQGEAAD